MGMRDGQILIIKIFVLLRQGSESVAQVTRQAAIQSPPTGKLHPEKMWR